MSDPFSFPSPIPQGGGGQDLPQPGTPQWAALMAMLSGQGPMAGQIPGQQMMATTTPTAGGGNQPPPGPLAANAAPTPLPHDPAQGADDPSQFPDAISRALAGLPAPASRVVAGHSPAAVVAQPPVANPPVAAASVKQQQPQQKPAPTKRAPPVAPAATDDSMLYPFKAIGGAPATGAAAAPVGAGLPDAAVAAQAAQRAAAAGQVTPPTGPLYPAADVSLYPHALIPGAPSSGAVPNLGYYRPTPGNARVPMPMQYGANDPRMFRGPLASQPSPAPAPAPAAAAPPAPTAPAAAPAAPGPGPIAPGVGTLWLRKMFGGAQPTA